MMASVNSFLNFYDKPVKIHILHNDPKNIKKVISPLYGYKNVDEIKIYKFIKNKNFLFPAIENHHVTEATYYRLFLHNYIPDTTNKLLYIDPDVIAMNNLTKVLDDSFNLLSSSKFTIGGVSYSSSINDNNLEMFNRLGMKSTKYFNAGVLLIDYRKWGQFGIGEKILSHTKEMDNLEMLLQHDQDVLNSFFDGKFFELGYRFNYPLLERFYSQDKEKIENSYFVHYVGREKPWLLNGVFGDISKYYQKNFKEVFSRIHFVNDGNFGYKSIFKFYVKNTFFRIKKVFILYQVLKETSNKV